MTQSYGTVRTGASDIHTEHRDVGDNEGSTLLGSEVVLNSREGYASIISSVSNLSNTIIGSGALFSASCMVGVTDGPNS